MIGATTKRSAIAATLAALLGMVAMATTAWSAGDPLLEFSTDDQRRWSTHPLPLFPDTMLVPGEATASVLWVRHHAPSTARLNISMTDDATDPAGGALREWLTLTINDQAVAPGDTWQGPATQPGDVVAVQIEVTLDPEAPESIRRRSADTLSLLTFREVVVTDVLGPDDGDWLATSGAAVVPILLLASALTALGAALRRRSHRSRAGAVSRPGRCTAR